MFQVSTSRWVIEEGVGIILTVIYTTNSLVDFRAKRRLATLNRTHCLRPVQVAVSSARILLLFLLRTIGDGFSPMLRLSTKCTASQLLKSVFAIQCILVYLCTQFVLPESDWAPLLLIFCLLPDLLECKMVGPNLNQKRNGGIQTGINTAWTFEHTIIAFSCVVGIFAFIFQIVNKNSLRQTEKVATFECYSLYNAFYSTWMRHAQPLWDFIIIKKENGF